MSDSNPLKANHFLFFALFALAVFLCGAILFFSPHMFSSADKIPTDKVGMETFIQNTYGPNDLILIDESTIKQFLTVLTHQELLDTLDAVDPLMCHEPAHAIGKFAFQDAGDVPGSLALCSEVCMSGCIHGALLEAVAGDTQSGHTHVALEDFEQDIQDICTTKELKSDLEGTCIHGVGHALMSLSNGVTAGLEKCEAYTDEEKKYYCQTGAYMEVLGNRTTPMDAEDLLYPCEESTGYASACMRYQTTIIANAIDTDIQDYCNSLASEKMQVACFHGLGRLKAADIADEPDLIRLCESQNASATKTCVESAAEILHETQAEKLPAICTALSENETLYQTCTHAAATGLYSFDKDFTPYLSTYQE